MTLLWLLACAGGTTGDTGTGDTGAGDSAPPTLALGVLDGDCGVLDDGEWGSEDPFLFQNTITLVGFDPSQLTADGLTIWEAGNLGGSSLASEVLAFEVLQACEGASLDKTEGEIAYDDAGGKKTDLLVIIDGLALGISVTRAFHWPPEDPYTLDEARDLLDGKLTDLVTSAENAAESDAWARSMLHVVAYDSPSADQIRHAWTGLDSAVRGDHGVIITVTDGDDEAIY